MLLDDLASCVDASWPESVINRQFHLRLQPKLGFTASMLHMYMWARFLAREEVEPVPANTENSRTHASRISDSLGRSTSGRTHRKFDAWKHHRLQQREEFISFDLAIAENCREQARADRLMSGRVRRFHGRRGDEEVVAALDSRDLESRLPQGRDDLSPRDPRKASHATVIFWTPMKSSGSSVRLGPQGRARRPRVPWPSTHQGTLPACDNLARRERTPRSNPRRPVR